MSTPRPVPTSLIEGDNMNHNNNSGTREENQRRRRRSVPVTIRRTRTGSRTVGARRNNNNNNNINRDADEVAPSPHRTEEETNVYRNMPNTARARIDNNNNNNPSSRLVLSPTKTLDATERSPRWNRNKNNLGSPDKVNNNNNRNSSNYDYHLSRRSTNNSVSNSNNGNLQALVNVSSTNTANTNNVPFHPVSGAASSSSNNLTPGSAGGNNTIGSGRIPSNISLLPQRYHQRRGSGNAHGYPTDDSKVQLVKLKVYKDGESYAKILMVQRTIEFNDLRKLVLERWELDINGPSQLYYKDDEGDRIKIDSSEFKRLLQRHFATSDIVRIHIDSGKTNKGSTRPRVQSRTSEESDQVNMGSPSNNSRLISVPVVGRRGSVEDERVDPNTTAELFSRGREEPTSKNRLPSRTANRTGTTTAPAVDPWQVTLEAMEKDKMPWRKLGAIGKGAYGTVYEGVLENGRHVAVKVLDVPRQVQSTIEESAVSGPGQSVRKLIREINLMRRLEHKNIVAYIHCHITKLEDDNVRHRGGRSSLMTTPRNVNQPLQIEIIMELCSRGPLSQIVKQSPGGRLSVVEARKYIKQILQGLMYLHSRGVIHRDIKADNVLISNDGVAKLADFGCSRRIADATQTLDTPMTSQRFSTSRRTRGGEAASDSEKALNLMDSLCLGTMGGVAHTMVGTPLFMAPEVIAQDGLQMDGGGPSDDTSLGVSNTMDSDAVNLGTRSTQRTRKDTTASKDSGGYAAPADIWAVGCLLLELFGRSPWPLRGGNYIQVLFHIARAPADRLPPGVPENCQPSLYEFFSKCLQRDPKKRATARELLRTEWITCEDSKLENPPPLR